jgi:hypothetical protein
MLNLIEQSLGERATFIGGTLDSGANVTRPTRGSPYGSEHAPVDAWARWTCGTSQRSCAVLASSGV